MLTLANLIVHILEGVAVAAAIYLVTKRSLAINEFAVLVISITATFIVLDLFAPTIGAGARQGSGFGLGFMQVAGDPLPSSYFVEGMDDQEAVNYYNEFNPEEQQMVEKFDE